VREAFRDKTEALRPETEVFVDLSEARPRRVHARGEALRRLKAPRGRGLIKNMNLFHNVSVSLPLPEPQPQLPKSIQLTLQFRKTCFCNTNSQLILKQKCVYFSNGSDIR
jgi:hypothetical protein